MIHNHYCWSVFSITYEPLKRINELKSCIVLNVQNYCSHRETQGMEMVPSLSTEGSNSSKWGHAWMHLIHNLPCRRGFNEYPMFRNGMILVLSRSLLCAPIEQLFIRNIRSWISSRQDYSIIFIPFLSSYDNQCLSPSTL